MNILSRSRWGSAAMQGEADRAMAAVWAWLVGLEPRGIQLGLERVRELLRRMGDPHTKLRAVTVAGTNGKGSTASFVASILHEAGYRVGLYTSPHFVSVTERIRLGGQAIAPADFARLGVRVRDAMEAGPEVALTFFEALTVMAIVYFYERQVDVAVLEVGLGGRLDATNVVDAAVAVLCPVGLDHQAILGATKALIAAEKVAILKPGGTLISAVTPALWRDVVGPYAFEMRASARRLGVDFTGRFEEDGFRYRGALHRVGAVRLGIAGWHQGMNAAVACAAVEALQDHGVRVKAHHLAEGLTRARHRGRMERLEARAGWPATLIDGAHNPMGARVLARQIEAFLPERPRVMLFGVNPDKDVARVLKALVPEVDAVVLTQSTARPVGDFSRFERIVHKIGRDSAGGELHVVVEAGARQGLKRARALAGAAGGLLVTGSLYLIGEVLPEFDG